MSSDQVVNRPPTETKNIVKQSSVGNPAAALASDTVNKALLGRVLGYASGVSYSSVQDPLSGEVREVRALTGSFKAIPVDMTRPCVQSAKLGLPVHMIGPICDWLEHPENKGSLVEIAFDIGVERAKNPSGYSWYGIAMTDQTDPLAELEAKVAARSTTMALPPAAPAAPAAKQIEHDAKEIKKVGKQAA